MTLEYLIGLAAGIGRNFLEAEEALKTVKKRKERITAEDSFSTARDKVLALIRTRDYLIHLYDRESTESTNGLEFNVEGEALDTEVNASIQRLDAVKQEYGESSLAYRTLREEIQSRAVDPTTGALVPFGYLFTQRILQERRVANLRPEEKKHIVLIDGNNMHAWNALSSYDEVTAHLNAIGRALVLSTKHNVADPRTRTVDLVLAPGYVTRKHGTAGDEFVIDLYCSKTDVVKVVSRLFDQAFKAQNELYAPENRLELESDQS